MREIKQLQHLGLNKQVLSGCWHLAMPRPGHSEPGWHAVTLMERGCLTDLQREELGGGASVKPDRPMERTEAPEASEHRCAGGAREPGARAGVGRGYLLEGALPPGGLAPLFTGSQEKPGRATLGGALELSLPKTRKYQ